MTLEFLQAFRTHYTKSSSGASINFSEATTKDVCEKIVKKLWLETDLQYKSLSFVELVLKGLVPFLKPEWIGIATHFMSHAWNYVFDQSIDALETEYEDMDNSNSRFFWIDVFVVPQCVTVVPPLAWWATAFFHAVESEPHFVLIWNSWDEPICCKRAWCLWEMYAAFHIGRNVEDGTLSVIMPRSQRDCFQEELLKDVHKVAKKLLMLDSSNADAWDKNAKSMIVTTIKNHEFDSGLHGFDGMNAALKQLLKSWIAKIGNELCDNNQHDLHRHPSIHQGVGLINHQQGNYIKAEERYRQALSIHKANNELASSNFSNVDTLENKLETMYRLGSTLLKYKKDTKKQNEALQLFQCICETKGAPEIKRLRAQKMMAQAKMDTNQVEDAVVILRTCILKFETLLFNDGDVTKNHHFKNTRHHYCTRQFSTSAWGNKNLRTFFHCEKMLGTALRMLDQSEEALTVLEMATVDWCKKDGKSHDNYLSILYELALTQQAVGEIKTAHKNLTYIVETCIRELGQKHPKTKNYEKALMNVLENGTAALPEKQNGETKKKSEKLSAMESKGADGSESGD